MKVVILGYSGLIGNSILENLAKNNSIYIFCVGRNVKHKPFRNPRIKYFKWDFVTFKKSNIFFLKKANIIINCVGKNNTSESNLKNINVIFVKKLIQYINIHKSKVRLVHLSSVALYGGGKNYLGKEKIISENSALKTDDLYSESKQKADYFIQNVVKKNINKNFSYTILRISNVFGGRKKSNLFKYITFSLKVGFWIKCFNDVVFNFVNVKDVSQAVILTLSKLKISKNKTYIVSDDCKQYQLYKKYQNLYKKKIIKTHIPFILLKLLISFLPLPKKIMNFILIISSRVSYSNKKIKTELNFKPRFSLQKKIGITND